MRKQGEAELGYFVFKEDVYDEYENREIPFYPKGHRIAMIMYSRSYYFVNIDWKGIQPNMEDPDEIASSTWLGMDSYPADMMNGLPIFKN